MSGATHRLALALDLAVKSGRAMTEAGMKGAVPRALGKGGLRTRRPRAALARAGVHVATHWVRAAPHDNVTAA